MEWYYVLIVWFVLSIILYGLLKNMKRQHCVGCIGIKYGWSDESVVILAAIVVLGGIFIVFYECIIKIYFCFPLISYKFKDFFYLFAV